MMDSNRGPNFPNDQASECQSFGSNRHPRKISIGILMDSFAKPRLKDFAFPTEEDATPKANSAEDGKKMQGGVLNTSKGKQSEAPEQETSPWLSTRSLQQKLPMSEQVHSAEPTPILLATRPISETHNRVHIVKGGTAEGVEKLSFATTQEAMPEEEVEELQTTKAETRGSETLRMKLWEILGTISSPSKQLPNDYNLNMGAKNMKLLQKDDVEGIPVVKPRQNSDTIETDSECPDLTVGRPMTRSLTRKRATGKLKASNVKNAQHTYYKKENQEVNDSSYREEFSRRIHYAVSGGSLTFVRKRTERWTPGIKAQIMCSHEVENPGRNQPMKSRGGQRASREKSVFHRNGGLDNNELHQRRKSEFIEPKSVALEKDSHQVHFKDVPENLRNIILSPKLQENVEYTAQKLDNYGLTFGVKTPNNGHSPDFPPSKMKKPAEESSPGSPPKTELGQADEDSPAKITFNSKGIQSFKSFLASRSNYVQSDSETNFPVNAGRLEGSPPMKPKPNMEEPESRRSKPSSADIDSETSKEGSHAKVLEDSSKLQRHLDLNEQDGLASAVSLFRLALERVKSKMKAVVRKRSAEILMSVAEGIHLQLQTAESQIQADMGKLTSINKSKRKRIDMRFQELEGELNVIHASFKDKVNQHLQDCRCTVEGLDAHQMDLRGTLEKQSASHRKLVLQAEAAIEMQLNDAQRRITEIHNLAREKMFRLKYIVADCFKESYFS